MENKSPFPIVLEALCPRMIAIADKPNCTNCTPAVMPPAFIGCLRIQKLKTPGNICVIPNPTKQENINGHAK